MLLKGKKIIVTGGVTGIGKASVLAMVQEGAQVVSMSRAAPDSERARTVLDAAAKLGEGPVTHMQLDISDQNAVDRVFAKAIELMGGLDVLVNSAAVWWWDKPENIDVALVKDMFSVNVFGTMFTNAAAFHHFKDHGGGAIINYSSYAGVCGVSNMSTYCATKGAIIAYTRAIAVDWAPFGVRSNVICPAVVTEMAESREAISKEQTEQMERYFADRIPLGGKLGKVENAADLNVFLASDKAAFIHGQTLAVDGGLMFSR